MSVMVMCVTIIDPMARRDAIPQVHRRSHFINQARLCAFYEPICQTLIVQFDYFHD